MPSTASARRLRPKPKGPARPAALRRDAAPGEWPAPDRVFAWCAYALMALFAIAALAFIVGPHQLGDYMTETDFYGAYAQGARLVQRGILDPSRYGVIGPGYEVALGLFGFLVPNLFLAAELLSLLASLAVLLLWFRLVRRRASAMAACLMVLFLAVNAHFLRHAYSALTDAPAIALQAATLFLLLGAPRAGTARLLGAGVCAGLAFLTRYNSIALLIGGVAAVAWGATDRAGADRERADGAAPPAGAPFAGTRLGRVLVFAGGFLLPVAPWVVYSLSRGQQFTFQLHHNIAYEVFARARGIPWDDYQKKMQPEFRTLWDVIARDPKAVFGRMLFNVFDHLRLDATNLLTLPVAFAAAFGILLGGRDGSLQRLWPVWLVAALLFLTLVPVFYSERYSLALLPAYATLAALAFASPVFAFAVRGGRRWLKPLLAIVPVATALAASVKVQARMIDQLPIEVLTAARTLREQRRPGDVVIARKGHIAYHGGVEPMAFPFADSLPPLAAFAHEHKIRWLYFSWPEAETRPALWYLLDTTSHVPGLTPRVVTRPHPAVLYEIGPEFGRLPAWAGNDTLFALHKLRAQMLVDWKNPTILYNHAMVARMLGRLDESRASLEKLIRIEPDNTQALTVLGDVLLTTNDPRGAAEVFARVLAIDPANVLGNLGRGWALLLSGDSQGAAGAWRPYVDQTTDLATLDRMARLFDDTGDHATAARARARLAAAAGGAP